MRDDLSSGKKWEEKIYWTHFQSVQFFQILSGHYEQQLAIPEKFVKNLGDKLGKEVSLKVPSGAIWNVGLISSGGIIFFKLGWKEFVKDNSLKKNDVLIFKYNGNLQFDVLLFDQQNLCEKEASYFVQKCGNSEMSSGCRRKESLEKISRENRPTSSYVPRKEASYFVQKCGNTEMSSGCRRKESLGKISRENRPTSSYVPRQERSSDVESDSSDDVTERTPSKRPKKVAVVIPNSVAQDTQGNGKTQGSKMSSTSGIRARHAQYPQSGIRAWYAQYPQPGIRVLNAQYEQFSSNRRPVTEEEKENAIQMAHAAASPDSLIVVMQPFHVYRSFVLTLPSWWARDHIPPKVTHIILRVEGKSWNVKFRTRGGSGMLTTRWKDFALGNLLEEFDVCLFNIDAVGRSKPAIGRFTTIVMDVSIFRVVEEMIPPTPLPTEGDESNGQSKTVKAKCASMHDL